MEGNGKVGQTQEKGNISRHWKNTFEETDIAYLGNCSRENRQLLLTSLGDGGAEHLPGSTTHLRPMESSKIQA